jgi:DNA-directed RNA polymerase specialized sigma24 family protein
VKASRSAPLALLVDRIADAAKKIERARVSVLIEELARLWCHRINAILRRAGVRPADLDDARQQALLRLWLELAKAPDLQRPEAWIAMLVHRVALDAVRARRRAPVVLDGDEDDDERLDMQAAHDGREAAERAREQAEVGGRLRAGAAVYAARADGLRAPRGHHVLAWFMMGPLDMTADDVAHEMSTEHAPVKGQTMWQWKHRGAELVRNLAAADPDPLRAEVMAAAARAEW